MFADATLLTLHRVMNSLGIALTSIQDGLGRAVDWQSTSTASHRTWLLQFSEVLEALVIEVSTLAGNVDESDSRSVDMSESVGRTMMTARGQTPQCPLMLAGWIHCCGCHLFQPIHNMGSYCVKKV